VVLHQVRVWRVWELLQVAWRMGNRWVQVHQLLEQCSKVVETPRRLDQRLAFWLQGGMLLEVLLEVLQISREEMKLVERGLIPLP
jgi:hypothetical protein